MKHQAFGPDQGRHLERKGQVLAATPLLACWASDVRDGREDRVVAILRGHDLAAKALFQGLKDLARGAGKSA